MAVYRLPEIDLSLLPLGVPFDLPSSQFTSPCWMLFYNESPYLLNIDLPDGSGEQLNPFLADWFYVSGNNVQITPIAFLSLASPPSTKLLTRVYTSGPPAERSYPLDLSRATIVGGGLSVNQLINDGNPSGTQFIESTPSGGVTAISVKNDGTIESKPESNGAQVDAFKVVPGGGLGVYAVVQFDNAEIVTDGKGNMSWAAGGIPIVNVNTTPGDKVFIEAIDSHSGKTWQVLISSTGLCYLLDFTDNKAPWVAHIDGSIGLGNQLVLVDANGVGNFTRTLSGGTQNFLDIAPSDNSTSWQYQEATSGDHIIFSGNEVGRWKSAGGSGLQLSGVGGVVRAWSHFTGNATGTYSHGLGTTPNVVLLNASAVGSETLGWDSPTGTTVHITNGAAIAWTAMALLMA